MIKTKTKRLLAGLVVLLLMIASIPLYEVETHAESLSEDDWQYSVNNDGETITITKYLGAGGNVVIPATIVGKKVTDIGYNAFYNNKSLTSITIPSSVTAITAGAFADCTALSSITVAEENPKYNSRDNCNAVIETQSNELIVGCKNTKIPSNVTGIGSQAFSGCTGLTDITLPDGVKSIGDRAFNGCGLTSIVIPQSVTSLNGMNSKNPFYGCNALSSIVVVDGNAKYDSRNNCNAVIEKDSNTLRIGCKNTKIPEGVVAIGQDAFWNCSGLIAIEIPDSVTEIGYRAFSGCSSLSTVTIPENVENIQGFAFASCSSLKSINIPTGIKEVQLGAFQGCSSLSTINIPDGVEKINVQAFWECNNLKNVSFPESVTDIGGMAFYGCESLESIVIPENVESIGNSTFYGCSSLTNLIIPKNVTNIGTLAFANCNGLESIKVESGNAKYDSRNDCNGIVETESNTLLSGCKNTVIPESVTDIGNGAFSGCSDLTELVIPTGVTSIKANTFSDCNNLISVTIPDGVTSIGSYAFSGCSKLSSLNFPKSIEKIESYAFYGCSSLKNIIIPEGVVEIGVNAFMLCNGLESIKIESGNPKYDSRDDCNGIIETENNTLLFGCKNTVIPVSVTKIGNWAFYDCSDLANIVIPESVTDIGDATFYGCQGLTSITIPSSVTKIGEQTFANCAFTEVAIPSSVTEIGSNAFGYQYSSNESGEYADKIPGFTIHGDSGSAAEIYAKENGFIIKASNSSDTNTPGGNPGNPGTNQPNPDNSGNQTNATVKVEKIAISGLSHKIATGKKITLKATVTPSNATNKSITWKSSNTKYATVNNKGVVTIKKAGAGKTVTITATANDGSGKKATYKIKCMKGIVKKVAISGQKNLSLKAGKSINLKTKVTASKGANKTLQWTSSNPKYAAVTNKGKVTAKKAGKGKTVKITAMATDGSDKKASVKIKIK